MLQFKQSENDPYFCTDCKIALATKRTYQSHLQTKKHTKNVEGRCANSIEAFQRCFGDRLFDITTPGMISIEETLPWLGLSRSDVGKLTIKIFPSRLHWLPEDSAAIHAGLSLNEFKMLLIAARTETSWRAFQHMRDIRSKPVDNRVSCSDLTLQKLESAWNSSLRL